MPLLCSIQYLIQGNTDTNRRFGRYTYLETVSIEISEVHPSDAPVAVEWTPEPYKWLGHSDKAISGPDGMQHTRWHANSHWQRLSDGHFYGKKARGNVVTVADLQNMLANPNQSSAACVAVGIPAPNNAKATARIAMTEIDPRNRFKTIHHDGREKAMLGLQTAADSLISVGGHLYRRCIEPFVSVVLDSGGGRLCVRGVGIETTHQALWGPTTDLVARFGIGSWDAAMSFARDPANVGSEPVTLSAPRILMPEALVYDWSLSYNAAIQAKAIQNALRMISLASSPILDQIVASQDAEEQYELLLSFDIDDPTWADNELARRKYKEAIEILEGRPIAMSLPKRTPYGVR